MDEKETGKETNISEILTEQIGELGEKVTTRNKESNKERSLVERTFAHAANHGYVGKGMKVGLVTAGAGLLGMFTFLPFVPTVAVVGGGYAFKKFVFDPYLKKK